MNITRKKIIEKKDNKNKYYGTGKRKTAVARVWISSKGSGRIIINGMEHKNYFQREIYLTDIESPLKILKLDKFYDITCTVKGSGLSGQSGAIRLGISRALCKVNKKNHILLRSKGLVTRDSRQVERKKYGQPKARKKFQFSKR